MKAENLEENISKEEIKSMVEAGQANGVFNETEKEMINSIFEFDDILASEIMIPRTDVYSIDIDVPINEYIDELLATKHSRIPVYEEDIDNIIGVLYIKDLILEARNKGFENVDIVLYFVNLILFQKVKILIHYLKKCRNLKIYCYTYR